MKRFLLLNLFFMISILTIPAAPENNDQHSIALTDDARAILINPAAQAYANSTGIGFMQTPGNLISGTADFTDKYYFLAATPYIGGLIGHEGEQWFKSLTFSTGPVFNIYAGAGYSWSGTDPGTGALSLGLLARPVEALSLGSVYRITKETGDWSIGAGIGLRPLFLFEPLSYRLELGADIFWNNAVLNLPSLYIKTEPLDGIILNGSFSLSDYSFNIGISVTGGGMLTNFSSGFNPSGAPDSQTYYIQLNPLEYPSVFTANSSAFYDYSPGVVLSENPGITPEGLSIFTGSNRTIWDVIEEIESLSEDDRISGLLFRNKLFQCSRTNFHELEEALLRFKATGKKIVFYYEIIDTANYALAAATADRIYLNPSGSVYLSATGTVKFYFNDFLVKHGIRTVDLQSHEYKTANNSYTKSTMTEAEREALTEVYLGLQKETERSIEKGRSGMLSVPVEEIFNHGPYLMAADALEAGLVDGIIYESELDDEISNEFKNSRIQKTPPRSRIRRDWADPYSPEIAVIYATGAIYPGTAVPGKAIGSDTIIAALRQARNNPATKAIILRVDSPGGSALASDIIAKEVSICREAPWNLPVVVSMGSVAGSGGYYISCTSDYIIARPDTITGSIGVTALSLDMEGLLEKLDINTVNLFTHDGPQIGNLSREMNEEEYKVLMDYICGTYDIFVNTVAKARGMSYDEVNEIAQGRIWTGTKALELGLIDKTGSFHDAVTKASELAGLEREPELVTYNGYQPELGQLGSLWLSSSLRQNLPSSLTTVADELEILQQFGNNQALALMPLKF